MIKLENTETYGWESAIRSMRNPLNSWQKSDSVFDTDTYEYIIGEADLKLAKKLVHAGTDHSKFMRMIGVSVDITANQPFWSQFDTYKVGTVKNSCSKMHTIHLNEFTKDMFDHEGLDAVNSKILDTIISELEDFRIMFNASKEKRYWRAIIELLPMGYRLKATVSLNYAVLRNIYHSRKNHKLDEWHTFCEWIEKLPHSELITME
jgi:hypothetical protein